MKNKPNLFIIGAPRSGTTSLYEYLKTHPNIFMTEDKEIGYFCEHEYYKHVKTIKEYEESFKDVSNEKIIGESTPTYIFTKTAPKNIFNLNPKAKIIFIKRNSNEAVLSSIKMYIREDKLYLKNNFWDSFNHEVNLNRYRKYFPSSQILVIDFKLFKNKTREVYLEVLKFLDVEDDGRIDFPVYNQGYKPKIKVFENVHRYIVNKNKWLKSFFKIIIPKGVARKIMNYSRNNDISSEGEIIN